MTNVILRTFQQKYRLTFSLVKLDEIPVMLITWTPGQGSNSFMDDVAGPALALHGWGAPSIVKLAFVVCGPVIEKVPIMVLDLVSYDLQMVLPQGIIRIRVCNVFTAGILYSSVTGLPGKVFLLCNVYEFNRWGIILHEIPGYFASIGYNNELKVRK